jgi:hypothetical protein
MSPNPYRGFRFPPEVIQHAVRLGFLIGLPIAVAGGAPISTALLGLDGLFGDPQLIEATLQNLTLPGRSRKGQSLPNLTT